MNGDKIQTSVEAYEATAIPCGRAVHADPCTPASAEQKPLPAALAKKPIDQKSPAEWAYERLILYIKNFEEQLDARHEVAIGFTGGEVGVLRIEGLGFFDPDIVTFYGRDDGGTKTQLIQHVTQLNVMLRATARAEPAEPARRIGFRLAEDWDEPQTADAPTTPGNGKPATKP
ncbi:MAG: DUF6173 family protein [Paracoccaceae bacterium]